MLTKVGLEALHLITQPVKRRLFRVRPRLTLEEREASRLRRKLKEIAGRQQFERLLNSALLHGGFNG